MLISQAFETYRQEFIIFRGQSKRTEELSQVAMKSLIQHCGDIPLSELTFDHVRSWRDDLSKTRSQNTVRIYILKLRVVLTHFRIKGMDILNPKLIGVPKRQTTTVNFLTPEEVDYLIECIFKPQSGYSTLNRYRNRAMAALLAASGIRVSELIRLNIEDLKPDRTFTTVGKGDRMRLCFFDERSETYINEYLALRPDNERALFVSERTSKRISKSTVEEVFKTATRRCGFPKPVTPHTMRHSFATHMLRQNTNLYYVSKFLGHKSVQTTEMYTHFVDEDLKRIYNQAHTS